jgi:hypothetical protein
MRRRSFLQGSVLAASALKGQEVGSVAVHEGSRKKVAAISTSYLVHSDADSIITRFLEGYWINDDYYRPACDVASLYIDRMPAADVGSRISAAYRVPILPSISDALTLRTRQLAVDGILLVGDNDGPDSRFDFFTQIVAVFRKTGRSVPVFCAGYLSLDWDHARQMYQQSREMGFPLMAGSSAAVTFRRPEMDYPLPGGFDDAPLGDRAHHDYQLGVEFDNALVIIPGGSNAISVFSGVEILQSFLERRRAGESGIRAVECLVDAAVWRAAEKGQWSKELMEAALGRAESLGKGRPENVEHPLLWLIYYKDGTRGALLSLGSLVREWLVAFRVTGRREVDSTLFYTPIESRNDFSMLVHGVSQMMVTGNCPYPVERNLLTTGALSFLRESARQGKPIETPTLEVAYTAPQHSFYAHGRGW